MSDTMRRHVALYGLVRSQRERLLHTLSRAFCSQCGWVVTEYVDNVEPQSVKISRWRALLEDVAARKYYAVVMFQDAPGLDEYCRQYDTYVAVISPDTSSHAPSGQWRRVKVGQ